MKTDLKIGRLLNKRLLTVALLAALAGCATTQVPENATANAQLSPTTRITRDLMQLPKPKGKVAVAVYAFRDQTGQYKPSPDSSFATAVTQGATSLLVKALKDSGWYLPVERENLQNLLTERKILRAIEVLTEQGVAVPHMPALTAAQVLIEGGVIAYESNVRTGGAGARFLGVGPETKYRTDQVTVNLRAVDIRSGQVLSSVSTTKTIYSYEASFGVFAFVTFKQLLEVEAGMTRNEPVQLCVREAIEAAVVAMTVQGLKDKLWLLEDAKDWDSPVVQAYLKANAEYGQLPENGAPPPSDGGRSNEIESLNRPAG